MVAGIRIKGDTGLEIEEGRGAECHIIRDVLQPKS
jgi:hypothetical protein